MHVETSIPKVLGWSTISVRFLKCGSMNTFSADIANNTLHVGAVCFAEFNLQTWRTESNVGDASSVFKSEKLNVKHEPKFVIVTQD